MAQTWPAATPFAFEVSPCFGWPSPGPSPLNVKASRTAWASPGRESWKRERERGEKKKERTKERKKKGSVKAAGVVSEAGECEFFH